MGAQQRGMAGFFTVAGIAAVWALGSIAVQLLCDKVILNLPFSIAPPRWWWYSPLPWPRSILTAAVFALVGMAVGYACLRGGITRRQLMVGAGAGVALLWMWAFVDAAGFMTYFGALQGLSFVRIGSAIGYAGTIGSLAGALTAIYLQNRSRTTDLAST
jgi:hypothetical protein